MLSSIRTAPDRFYRGLISILLTMFLTIALGGCTTLSAEDRHSFAGKTFVVTGASSGIGRGVAEKLGSLHANVVLAARRTSVLNEVAEKIRAANGTPLTVTTDVARPEDLQQLADAAIDRFGRIDVWINNAGVTAFGRFEDIPLEDHSRLIDVNLKGVLYGSHEAMKRFRAQGRGVLINVGSLQSEVPVAYQGSYAASKAGILNLGQALNQEIRLSGNDDIHVVTVMPWATDTPIWAHAAHYGATPRLPAMDETGRVINTIIHASVYPRDKVPVGWKAKTVNAVHRIFPGLVEHIASDIAHEYQIEGIPPAPPSSGNLHKPGIRTSVDGGFSR